MRRKQAIAIIMSSNFLGFMKSVKSMNGFRHTKQAGSDMIEAINAEEEVFFCERSRTFKYQYIERNS